MICQVCYWSLEALRSLSRLLLQLGHSCSRKEDGSSGKHDDQAKNTRMMESTSIFECLLITDHNEKQLMDSLSITQLISQIPAYLTSIEQPSIQLNLLLAVHSLHPPSQDLH